MIFQKESMLANYIYSNFCDIMNSRKDLQKAEYMKGKKVLLSYDYTQPDPMYDMLNM